MKVYVCCLYVDGSSTEYIFTGLTKQQVYDSFDEAEKGFWTFVILNNEPIKMSGLQEVLIYELS